MEEWAELFSVTRMGKFWQGEEEEVKGLVRMSSQQNCHCGI